MSNKGTTAVGVVVVLLVIGALASISYYQFEVAPGQNASTTSTTSQQSVVCGKTNCAYVSMASGAASCTNASSPCGFAPASITVVIGVNNTVVWTNDDQAVHTVTPLVGSSWGSSESPGVMPGGNYTYTFTAAGTYEYHCIYHGGMIGTVKVVS